MHGANCDDQDPVRKSAAGFAARSKQPLPRSVFSAGSQCLEIGLATDNWPHHSNELTSNTGDRYRLPIDKFPDQRHWINNRLDRWYVRICRLYGWNFRKNSLARKRKTNQYNIAKLNQPRQIMAAPVHNVKKKRKKKLWIKWLTVRLLRWRESIWPSGKTLDW